jgi:N-acetylmuramoyl-L-alanine amidase
VQRIIASVWRLAAALGIVVGAGCAPAVTGPGVPGAPAAPTPRAGLPPVPLVEGPLAIRVVYPTSNMVRPNVDSVLVYGSVGTGRAELTINGAPVEVAPNGAFIGFVQRPADDTLRLVSRSANRIAEASVAYRPPPPATAVSPVQTIDYPVARTGTVTTGGDTLATGSDVAIGRPTPTGAYRWFLPRGARLTLTGERDQMVRARLDGATEAWFPRTALTVTDAPPASPVALGAPAIRTGDQWSDVRVPAAGSPFLVQASDTLLEVTVHGATAAAARITAGDEAVALVDVAPRSADAVAIRIVPRGQLWGYKAFYEPDGTLAIRVRRAPALDPRDPLRGLRIVIDPGHPPGGATGPTGLTEAEANLAISLRLAELLRARGAEVLMTRTTAAEVSLVDRLNMAVGWDGHILISVHNNAFPEGANPFRRNGTSTYFFHPFSAGLAGSLNQEIVASTRIRDLGVLSGNLALVRPTWLLTALTESVFMPMPEQEAALRHPQFVEELAHAHLRGLDRFLQARLAGRRPT